MASINQVLLLGETALTASNTGLAKSLDRGQKNFIALATVTANDGSTTVDVRIETSADGINWIEVANLTDLVNVNGVVKLDITANLLTKARSIVTLTGTPIATVKVGLWHDFDR